MIITNRGRGVVPIVQGLLLLTAAGLHGQTPAPEKSSEEAPRRLSVGLRVRTLPVRSFSVMDNGHSMTTTTVAKTVYDLNYNTTSKSFLLGGGVAFEAAISRRATLSAELLFNRLRYDKVNDTYSGVDDPNTSNDERAHKTATENTKARLFDLPVLLHYEVGRSGFLSHLYVSGGATARNVSAVRTTHNITNADGTQENNQIRADVSKRTLLGATVGVGFRFVDEFNIKVTPEVRYTRWNGLTFGQDSTRSPRNQLEVGIAFTK